MVGSFQTTDMRNTTFILHTKKPLKEVKELKAILAKYEDEVNILLINETKMFDFAKSMCYYMELGTQPPMPWNGKYTRILNLESSIEKYDEDFKEYYANNFKEINNKYLNKILVYSKTENSMSEELFKILEDMNPFEKITM